MVHGERRSRVSVEVHRRRIPAPRSQGAKPGSGRLSLPYVYRVPLCVPFWNARTYGALLQACLMGRIVAGPNVARLEERLAARFAVPTAIACGSGRAALELALRATGVGEGDEVVVPTFCCASILPPILAVGAVPVLADVGATLTLTPGTIEAVRTERTRAVVVAHLFGNPAPIERIADMCRSSRLIMIDDAAQALGASHGGRLLGTFGDAGIVSFGNGKVCFGTGGGLLMSRNPVVLARAETMRFPNGQGCATVRRATAVTVWRRWRRWSLPIKMTWSRFRGEAKPDEYRGQSMSNLDAAVALTLLDTLDTNLAARRLRAQAYGNHLGIHNRYTLVNHQEGSACLTQLVSFGGNEALALRVVNVLREAGYEVDRSFRPLHLQAAFVSFARGPLPVAERAWLGLVELPCEPSVSFEDVQRIAQLIRATVNP